MSRTWGTKTDFVPTLVHLLEAWLKHCCPDLLRHQNLYIELLTSLWLDIISSSVQRRQLRRLDWTKLAELTRVIYVGHLLVAAAVAASAGWKTARKYSAFAHCVPHLLISCAELSSRRPLLALSFIHIAAEARGESDMWRRTSGKHSPVTIQVASDPVLGLPLPPWWDRR